MKAARITTQLPALLQALIVAVITLYPIWFTIHYRAVYDPDIWWHMRAGDWVLHNRAVPHTDWLSTAGAGKPWVLYSWMFDVLVAALYRGFGLFGPIILYPVVMVMAIAAALFVLLRELALHFWHQATLLAASLLAIAPICSPRPGLLSVFFLALELALLLHARRTGSSRWLYALPLVFVIWANVHVQFVYGLFVLTIFVLEPWFERTLKRAIKSVDNRENVAGPGPWILALCVAATLLNPYLLGLYRVIGGLATQAGQYRYISELQAPTFRTVNGVVELCMIVAAWFALVRRRTFRWVPVIFLLAGTVLAFRTVRDVWFGVLAAIIAMAWPHTRRELSAIHEQASLVAWASLIVLAGAVVIGKSHPLSETELWKDTADEFPVAAVDYVKKERWSGPLYNDWNWGGFLAWALPGIPVYVDSRTNIPGDQVLEQSISVWSGEPGWAEDPALLSARLVIANRNNPLTSLLRFDPRFRVTYEDATAVVFVARSESRR